MKSKILILFGFFIIIGAEFEIISDNCTYKYCYDLDFAKESRFQFGTKAPYPRYTDFDVNQEFNVPKCEPVKMWLIVRHGARLPTREELSKFGELTEVLDVTLRNYQNIPMQNRCKLCSADLELLRNWKFKDNITNLKTNHLVPEGLQDMKMLGHSFSKMFPTLFDRKFSADSYLFGHATEHRTRYSFYGFLEGLFGEDSYLHIPKPTTYTNHDDPLLQPYAQCKDSIDNAKLVDKRREQADQFSETTPFKKLIKDVSLRLGFNETLPFPAVKTIWDICKYEQGWHPLDPSPWCVAFLPHHYPYLEYYDDIKFYYKKSYGTPLTLKLACAAVNNLLYYLDSNDNYKVIAYFVHSTLMQLLYTALGLFKDKEHLRADNFDKMQDRLFKSSNNLPLSSNLAIIKYKCSIDREKYKIMFLLNQKPIVLSWCGSTLCNLKDIKRHYFPFAQLNCSESFCDPNFSGFKV